jgi:hypothetical protein
MERAERQSLGETIEFSPATADGADGNAHDGKRSATTTLRLRSRTDRRRRTCVHSRDGDVAGAGALELPVRRSDDARINPGR